MRFEFARLAVVMLLSGCLAVVQITNVTLGQETASPGSLEVELQQLESAQLAAEARSQGDPARGSVLFHRPDIGCSKCHSIRGVADQSNELGPDLTLLRSSLLGPGSQNQSGIDAHDQHLVESVLFPSRVIGEGYRAVTALTTDGRVITGVLKSETGQQVTIRVLDGAAKSIVLDREQVDQWSPQTVSLMPTGQVNLLGSKQAFLDLIRFLMEIRDGGAQRAEQLRPAASQLVLAVPDYEHRVDHAGLIRQWNAESFARGEAIYNRVCANCHGTVDQEGSLPSSLRFASGRFKHGSDPFSMYRTLTYGYGFMTAQSWMVPTQKYDVIHYIREHYLKSRNPSQYSRVDRDYLSQLPTGDTFGPEPSTIQAWSAMDYGPSLTHTYQIPGTRENFAYKGVAVRLDAGAGGISRGSHWMIFDTDTLRMAGGWSASAENEGRFIDWQGIQFDGAHGVHPRVVGELAFQNSTGPGWADPQTGSFDDQQRVLGRDGKQYGPLPQRWGKFLGMYHYDNRVVFSYRIGDCQVLESPSIAFPRSGFDRGSESEGASLRLLTRTFNVGARSVDLFLQVAEHSSDDASGVQSPAIRAGFVPSHPALRWEHQGRRLVLRIAAGDEPVRFTVWQPTDFAAESLDATTVQLGQQFELDQFELGRPDMDLKPMTEGGASRWGDSLNTPLVMGSEDGPLATDELVPPEVNPWLAQTRFTGLDFFADGRLAVCSWDGDVWIATVNEQERLVRWRRIASGLFQPLGLKIIEDKIHLMCRDQLVVLHDLNGDEEIDFYECLNNDHQVTEHFHEFAMGLQTDDEGNFYYAKSGQHGLAAIVPHHGTLLRIAKDGSHTTILANGFRAANGVCLNPDGTFFVTDQEGFWNPKNRINWVTIRQSGEPKFYGNMLGYHQIEDPSDSAMEPPLCWITNAMDRSPGELLWVDSPHWGALSGSLLNLSYGYGKVFLVLPQQLGNKMQGGVLELPMAPFPTGVMRGRFDPIDKQLYVCGMFAWAGDATKPGGLYRLRPTGKPFHLPTELRAVEGGLELKFTEPLAASSVVPERFQIKVWGLKRSARYGSKHFDERVLKIKELTVFDEGRKVLIDIEGLEPTWCMEITYDLKAASGETVRGVIHNTIHELEP